MSTSAMQGGHNKTFMNKNVLKACDKFKNHIPVPQQNMYSNYQSR